MRSRVIVLEETDEALVERCRKGDRAAFTMLVARYQRPIYNAAYRVLGREEDANDIAQIVFLRIAQRFDEYDPRYKFFSWIYRIAVNESLNLLRRQAREEQLDDDAGVPDGDSANPEWQTSQAQSSQRIQKALMSLKASDRAVITLRHFGDCSYEEIAQILDIGAQTVKSRLFEARQRLRELLEDLRPVT